MTQILREIFDKAVSQFPVIGPHLGIEAKLLESGLKPMGVLPVIESVEQIQDPYGRDRVLYDSIEHVKRLDELVREGRLISKDLTWTQYTPDRAHTIQATARYYAQPDQKQNLENHVTFKEHWRDNKSIEGLEIKPEGDYYGYRQRDQALWENVIQNPEIPNWIKDAIYFVNRNITQPAYLRDQERKAQKIINSQGHPKTIKSSTTLPIGQGSTVSEKFDNIVCTDDINIPEPSSNKQHTKDTSATNTPNI